MAGLDILKGRLRIPVIGAPLFIISNPQLVIAQCKAGVVGSFPALNARPQSQLDEWLDEITSELDSYNAAMHIAQFWDGRAADVEEQAKGPVLNPVEMAMASEEATVAVLKSIPGYGPKFEAAFGDTEITYDRMANAIGAFERKLVTPGKFDKYVEGDASALSDAEKAGLDLFVATGCTTCHMGPAVGGSMYQKLGLVNAYEPRTSVGPR